MFGYKKKLQKSQNENRKGFAISKLYTLFYRQQKTLVKSWNKMNELSKPEIKWMNFQLTMAFKLIMNWSIRNEEIVVYLHQGIFVFSHLDDVISFKIYLQSYYLQAMADREKSVRGKQKNWEESRGNRKKDEIKNI